MLHRRINIFLACLLLFCCGCTGNQAGAGIGTHNEDLRHLARQYVQKYVEVETAEAKAASSQLVHSKLEKLIDKPTLPVNQFDGFLQEGDENELALGKKLETILPGLRDKIKEEVVAQAQASVASNMESDKDKWTTDLETVLVQEQQLSELESSRHLASTLGFYLSGANRFFWLFSFVALFMVLVATAHARRHQIRRLLNGGKAKTVRAPFILIVLVAILAVITLGVFFFGDTFYRTLSSAGTSERYQALQTELAGLNKKAKISPKSLDEMKQRADLLDPKVKPWVQENIEFYIALASLSSANQVSMKLAEKWSSDAQRAADSSKKIADKAGELEQLQKDRFRMQAWLGTFMLLAACGIITWLIWRERSIERFNRLKCPKCLSQGTLKVQPNSEGLMICKAPQKCDFEMPREYQAMSKLYFPLLGHIQAGKTFWLAMNYKQLNEGNFPQGVQFEKLDGRSSQEFDKIVADVFAQRKTKAQMYTSATQVGSIPFPLIYNFLDKDRFGRSKMLVSLFDYSGEITQNPVYTFDQSNIRRRAMFADGYLFFLDPTTPNNVQQAALERFRQDVRRAKKKSIGSTLDMPIALVISKIDTLFEPQNVAKYGKENLTQMLKELDSVQKVGTKLREQEMNLSIIEKRSQIMEQYTELLFPGWKIARQVTDLFGGRVMFFPETPIGLNNLGKPVDQRLMEPFGLLEPLLWLIQMNGYPVLGR